MSWLLVLMEILGWVLFVGRMIHSGISLMKLGVALRIGVVFLWSGVFLTTTTSTSLLARQIIRTWIGCARRRCTVRWSSILFGLVGDFRLVTGLVHPNIMRSPIAAFGLRVTLLAFVVFFVHSLFLIGAFLWALFDLVFWVHLLLNPCILFTKKAKSQDVEDRAEGAARLSALWFGLSKDYGWGFWLLHLLRLSFIYCHMVDYWFFICK